MARVIYRQVEEIRSDDRAGVGEEMAPRCWSLLLQSRDQRLHRWLKGAEAGSKDTLSKEVYVS